MADGAVAEGAAGCTPSLLILGDGDFTYSLSRARAAPPNGEGSLGGGARVHLAIADASKLPPSHVRRRFNWNGRLGARRLTVPWRVSDAALDLVGLGGDAATQVRANHAGDARRCRLPTCLPPAGTAPPPHHPSAAQLFACTLAELRQLGVTVAHGIDATELRQALEAAGTKLPAGGFETSLRRPTAIMLTSSLVPCSNI